MPLFLPIFLYCNCFIPFLRLDLLYFCKMIAFCTFLLYNLIMKEIQCKRWYGRLIYPDPTKQEYPEHYHPHFELYFFIRGNAEYLIEGQRYTLQPNTLIIINPGIRHQFRPLGPEEYERVVIGFDKDVITPELQSLLPQSPQIYYLGAEHEIMRALPRLDYVVETYKMYDQSIMLMLYINEFLLRLSYLRGGEQSTEGQTHPLIQQAINYINANITEPINMNTLSKDLFVSRSYLSNTFSKYMHLSIMEYVKQRKILYAQKLIRTGIPPTEAAIDCGFTTYSTFYRLYKKLLNLTPEQEKTLSIIT